MGHINSVLMALSKCPNPTVFQKTLALNDFYFGSEEWQHPMGHISFVGKLDGVTLSAGAPAIAPGWTLELMGRHSLDFWLTSEDLPDPENRVTLDRDGRIVLSYRLNNEEGHRRLIAKLESLMQRQRTCAVHGHECHQGLFSRNLFVGQRIPLAGVAHQNGTIRFGRDPQTLGARSELPGPRGGQPVRGGRQLLSLERRGEPGADHHGQRAAGRRPHSRPARYAAE